MAGKNAVSKIPFVGRDEGGDVRPIDPPAEPELTPEQKRARDKESYRKLQADERSAFTAPYVAPKAPEVNAASDEEKARMSPKHFRVTKGGQVRLPGQFYTLRPGKIVSSHLYPVQALLQQGIELVEVTAAEAGWIAS